VLTADTDSEDGDESANKWRARDEPRTIFRRSAAEGTSYYAIWNCVLFQDSPGAVDRDALPSAEQLVQALANVAQQHVRWGVVMSSGGHFAAAVFEIRRNKKENNSDEWAHATVHKTIHRCDFASAGGTNSVAPMFSSH
jgi:hypothetical protein